jgi:hypothetical protein
MQSSVTCGPCYLAVAAKYFFIRPWQIAPGHVAVLVPSLVGRRGLEPCDTWCHWSPLERGGGIQSHGTRGGAGAIPIRAVGSGAAGHMAARGPTRPASCLSLELACGGTQSIGC